jgi:PAS domain S-box-containing protein
VAYLRSIALIVVVALAVSIFMAILFENKNFVFNPPYLLFVLNIAFWSSATVAVTYISAKSFLKDDSITILLLSVSMILLGVSIIISGWVSNFSNDYSFAIGNFCPFVASIILVLSGVFLFLGKQKTGIPQRRTLLASAYISTIIFIAIITAITLLGFMPHFWASGPTQLRQTVLGLTVFFFALASVIYGFQYAKSRMPTLFWYTLSIGLYCLGFFSAFEVTALGDVTTWLGRISLYVANIFLICALLEARKANKKGSDLTNGWSQAFIATREQSAKLFENMLNGFMYCQILTDSHGKPIDWIYLEINKSFEKILGLKREQVIGKKAREIIPHSQERDTDFADSVSMYGHIALTGESGRFELHRASLGKWLNVSAYSPKRGYFVSIFEDITERKKAEEKLEQYSKNLESLVEERTKQLKDAERLAAIGATAGMVGHDIRNPLQAIVSELYLAKETMTKSPDSKGKQDALDSMTFVQEQVDYISKIVADLQDYARPLNPDAQLSDIKAIVQETISKQKVPKEIEVSINIAENAKKINADPDYIKRIIGNLVLNAIQAMPKGGKLTINAEKEKQLGNIVLMVEDTGVGIADDVKDKMFTPMFTTKAKGQGFGLPVVKRMTETLGGTVTFNSEQGKGTTFTVRLPSEKTNSNEGN